MPKQTYIIPLAMAMIYSANLSLPADADAIADIDAIMQEFEKDKSVGNYADAEYHLKQALSTSVARTGSMASNTGRISRLLGEFYTSRGRYGEAEHFLERSLIINAGYTGAIATADGEFLESRRFINDSLKNPQQLPGNIEVANTLSSLSNLFTKTGRYSEAERLLKRIIEIYESSGGDKAGNALNYVPNSWQMLAEHQRSLAQVLYKEGNLTEAESMFRSSVETVRKEKGPSPELANALKHLAAFYKSQDRSSDADRVESEAGEMIH